MYMHNHVISSLCLVGQSLIIGSVVCFYARSRMELTGVLGLHK